MPQQARLLFLSCLAMLLASCAPAAPSGDSGPDGSPAALGDIVIPAAEPPALQIGLYGGLVLGNYDSVPLLTLWSDGRAVFVRSQEPEEPGDYLVREATLELSTAQDLLEQASVLYELEDQYVAYNGVDFSTVNFNVQTERGRKMVSAYGMSLQGDGTSRSFGLEQDHATLDKLRTLYRSVMNALPQDAPAARADVVVVLTRELTQDVVDRLRARGEDPYGRTWPAHLVGYLKEQDAVEAATLSPPGPTAFFLLESAPHAITVLPVIPYIPGSDPGPYTLAAAVWPGRGIPFHPASLAYPVLHTTWGGRIGAIFHFSGISREEVAAWYRAEMPTLGWRLAKEEERLQVWAHPEKPYHPISHVRIEADHYAIEDLYAYDVSRQSPLELPVLRRPGPSDGEECDGPRCQHVKGLTVEEARSWFTEYLGYVGWTQVGRDRFQKEDVGAEGPATLTLDYWKARDGTVVRFEGARRRPPGTPTPAPPTPAARPRTSLR